MLADEIKIFTKKTILLVDKLYVIIYLLRIES